MIAGTSRVSNATFVGPDPDLGAGAPAPGAIQWLIQGSQARFSRKGIIALNACAPTAKMTIGSGTTLTGRYVARSIRLKKATIAFAPPVPGVCGDTVISPGEQCEKAADCTGGLPCNNCVCGGSTTTTTTTGSSTTTTTLPPCDDDDDCDGGSPAGSFVCENGHCIPPCDDDDDCDGGSPTGSFVCEEGHCIPPCDGNEDCPGDLVCVDGHCVVSTTTTSTTTGSSTTNQVSTTTATTTTTLKSCTSTDDCPTGVCRDGFCVPECASDDDCNGGSPAGSFGCQDGRCVPRGEICGDCIDNDGDGAIDFEDPDCCDATSDQLYAMVLRKGRLRQKGGTQSLLRL
jgi:hypothetical protein